MSDDKQAPTTAIETVAVVRPLKVVAFLCFLLSVILLIVSLSSSVWLTTGGFRQGLFEECLTAGTSVKLSQSPPAGGCQSVKNRGGRTPVEVLLGVAKLRLAPHRVLHYIVYTQVVAALLVIAALLTFASTVTCGLGLTTLNSQRKYFYYRFALYIGFVAVALEASALVAFPVCFYQQMRDIGISRWDFDWAYGVGWGALIFTMGASLLLLCDKEHEEIYYKEKTIMGADEDA